MTTATSFSLGPWLSIPGPWLATLLPQLVLLSMLPSVCMSALELKMVPSSNPIIAYWHEQSRVECIATGEGSPTNITVVVVDAYSSVSYRVVHSPVVQVGQNWTSRSTVWFNGSQVVLYSGLEFIIKCAVAHDSGGCVGNSRGQTATTNTATNVTTRATTTAAASTTTAQSADCEMTSRVKIVEHCENLTASAPFLTRFTFPDGFRVAFGEPVLIASVCPPGFLSEQRNITCTAEGEWTRMPACNLDMEYCPDIAPPGGVGSYNYTGYHLRSEAQLECPPGYWTPPDDYLVCVENSRENGTWNGTTAGCTSTGLPTSSSITTIMNVTMPPSLENNGGCGGSKSCSTGAIVGACAAVLVVVGGVLLVLNAKNIHIQELVSLPGKRKSDMDPGFDQSMSGHATASMKLSLGAKKTLEQAVSLRLSQADIMNMSLSGSPSSETHMTGSPASQSRYRDMSTGTLIDPYGLSSPPASPLYLPYGEIREAQLVPCSPGRDRNRARLTSNSTLLSSCSDTPEEPPQQQGTGDSDKGTNLKLGRGKERRNTLGNGTAPPALPPPRSEENGTGGKRDPAKPDNHTVYGNVSLSSAGKRLQYKSSKSLSLHSNDALVPHSLPAKTRPPATPPPRSRLARSKSGEEASRPTPSPGGTSVRPSLGSMKTAAFQKQPSFGTVAISASIRQKFTRKWMTSPTPEEAESQRNAATTVPTDVPVSATPTSRSGDQEKEVKAAKRGLSTRLVKWANQARAISALSKRPDSQSSQGSDKCPDSNSGTGRRSSIRSALYGNDIYEPLDRCEEDLYELNPSHPAFDTTPSPRPTGNKSPNWKPPLPECSIADVCPLDNSIGVRPSVSDECWEIPVSESSMSANVHVAEPRSLLAPTPGPGVPQGTETLSLSTEEDQVSHAGTVETSAPSPEPGRSTATTDAADDSSKASGSAAPEPSWYQNVPKMSIDSSASNASVEGESPYCNIVIQDPRNSFKSLTPGSISLRSKGSNSTRDSSIDLPRSPLSRANNIQLYPVQEQDKKPDADDNESLYERPIVVMERSTGATGPLSDDTIRDIELVRDGENRSQVGESSSEMEAT